MNGKSGEGTPATGGMRVFGVVAAGKPLSRAVWTESRELAEDMLKNTSGDAPKELWEATLVARSP